MVVSGKKIILPSLSLGHAIHVPRSCQYEFSDAGWEAALRVGGPAAPSRVPREEWGEAWPPEREVCRGGCPPLLFLPLLLSLPATISFNHCRRHGTLPPRAGMQGAGCKKSQPPCSTRVGNYEFISMSFCLLGICTTHVVSVCFIYL